MGGVVHTLRIAAGFIAAPAPWLLLAAAERTFAGMSLMLIIVYGSTVAFGLPAYLIFRRLGWLAWWQVGLGGAACAAPLVVLVLLSKTAWGSFSHDVGVYLVASLLGAVTALWFWFVAIWRNPVAHRR